MNVSHIEVFVCLQILQNKFLKSGSTFIVFWFWRLFNGVSLINTAYLAITTEKVWVSPLLSLLTMSMLVTGSVVYTIAVAVR